MQSLQFDGIRRGPIQSRGICLANIKQFYTIIVRTLPLCYELFLEVKPLGNKGKKARNGDTIMVLTFMDRSLLSIITMLMMFIS